MSSTQDFTCVFCNEVFENKEILQVHFRKHGDPKFNSGPKNKSRPQSDQSAGEKSEDGEMVVCDVCDESFPSISKAITHKHKVHPDHDAKYFCPWCGKLFTMKHLYNKHMQSNHTDSIKVDDESSYHCDCCDVDFNIPSAMMYHNKFFHRQDTELPSIGHSKKVKTVNQTLIQIYYCPFCGEEYNNKVNLHKHMADDHSDENQSPDEILRCPLCDAVFYHLDAYELHLSFHTSDDVYNDESEMLLSMSDFSLETVPPLMEKVEEETTGTENQGIDKFLQLIMDESRESGNTDGNDKPKSKKHKKHKKSKKAAITLDEFLNMNKDVFGDGLDIQGIEEVPTQQVLKKCKGKNVTKPLPASALAKLKKQGITVKSNSSVKSPVPNINKNLIVNRAKILPNNIPVQVKEKPTTVTTSNEVLSKLLNQGNSQIKIVKRSTEEQSIKNKTLDKQDQEELTIQQMHNKLPNTSDTEEATESKENEMDHDVDNQHSISEASDQETTNNGENTNDACAENSKNVLKESANIIVNNENNAHYNDDNDTESKTLDQKTNTIFPEISKNIENATDLPTSDKDDTYETKGEASDEDMPSDSEIVSGSVEKKEFQQECLNKTTPNKTLDALKHLRGVITVKPAQSAEDQNDVTNVGQPSPQEDALEKTENVMSNVAKVVNKNVQKTVLKKPMPPQIKADTLTTSINKLKNLNNQLSIKSMSPASLISKDNEESDDPESEHESSGEFTEDIPHKNKINEEDSVIFKTPIATIKQTNATVSHIVDTKKPIQPPIKEAVKEEDDTKKSFNIDILKRLSNVTAKPVIRAQSNIQTVQNANPTRSCVQKVEKNKNIDQDIEIFNIDDSDDDQETPNDQPVRKVSANVPKNSEAKTTVSADVLKNLSKNITVKLPSPSNKNISNVKKDIQGEITSPSLDKNLQTPINDNKINIQKKQMNMNLSQTLKKLGNNISIKSKYSSPDPDNHQMFQDDDDDDADLDDNFNDDESDSETTSKVKISEVQDHEELPSDTDMEYNENVIVQSPHESNSENEEEHHSYNSDDETHEDFEKQIKVSAVTKEKSASNVCLNNFKRNNKELTIKSLNEKNTDFSPSGSPVKTRVVKNPPKDTIVKQNYDNEKQDDNEISTKKVNQAAASSSSQKVTNQVNTVKTVKTFQSETIIEEITTTVTKTIRTVNQSSKQFAQNKVANVNTFRPRLAAPNHVRPLKGITVRNAPTVGTKVRQAAPSPRPTIAMPSRTAGQLVPVRPQNQIIQRQGLFRPSAPGPSNIRKITPQTNVQKPVAGKPLKISPTAMNQSIKRPSDETPRHFSCFKKPKESIIPSMDAFDDEFGEDATVNYSSAASSRSDFSTTATKIVKGKAVVTATQARSEQHSEQHITKLNNMSGLKIVRTSAKQASQVETRNDNNIDTAKRTTLDAIERLQKQGLLIKKPRVETPEENEPYNSESDNDYDDQ